MEQQKQQTQITPKRSYIKLVIGICVTCFIFAVIILFAYKKYNPDTSLTTLWYWMLGFLIIFGGIIGVYYYFETRKTNIKKDIEKSLKEQPAPITFGECEELVNKIFMHPTRAQYLTTPEIQGVREVGKGIKSSIYTHLAKGKFKENGTFHKYCVIINMHYPEIKRKILTDPTPTQITKAENDLATYPSEEPGERIIEEENPLLGTRRKMTERLPQKEEDKKEPKKEELV